MLKTLILKVEIPEWYKLFKKFIVSSVIFSILMGDLAYAMFEDERDRHALSREMKPPPNFDETNNHNNSLSFADQDEHSFRTEEELTSLLSPSSPQFIRDEKVNLQNEMRGNNQSEFEEKNYIKNEEKDNLSLISVNLDEDSFLRSSNIIPLESDLNQDRVKRSIFSFIEKYLINEQEIPESKMKRTGRNVLKILFPLIIGLAEGVTALEPSCRAAQGNKILCVIYSSGTFIALGGAAAWAGLHLIGQFDPVSSEEIEILQSSRKYRVTKRVFTYLVSLLATGVPVFMVYKYNTAKWLAIPAFFTNFIFKARGFHELISFLSSLREQPFCSNQKGADLIPIQHIDEQLIPQILEDKYSSINSIKILVKKELDEYLNHTHDYLMSDNLISPKTWKNGYPRKITQLISLIFPAGDALVSGLLAYQAINLLISSPLVCFGGAVISVLPGFSLNIMTTTSTVGKIFDSAFNKLRKKEAKTLFSIYYPKTSKLIMVFAFSAATCFAISNAYIASDTISGFTQLGALRHVLPTLVLGVHVIFGSYTTSDLMKNAIEQCTALCGSARKRSILFIVKKLETIKKFVAAYFPFKKANQEMEQFTQKDT